MTGNFRFSDKHFAPDGKPPPVYFTWKDKKRQAAWWLESNRRKERGNGEGDLADPQGSSTPPGDQDTPSLADEIKAAKRKHRQRTGDGARAQDCQMPPSDMAENTAEVAESSKPGEDPARAKHDNRSDKEALLRLSKLSRAEYDRVRVKETEALGIRPPTLDKEVEALRPKGGD
jgi:hypothetical protein